MDKTQKKKIKPNIYRVWRQRPKPGWYYIYDLELAGHKVRTPRGQYFTHLENCENALSRIRLDHRRGKYHFSNEPTITLTELSDLWVTRLERNKRSKSHIAATRRVMDKLTATSSVVNVIDLRKADLEKYISNRLQDGISPQTVNTEMALIMGALNNADSVCDELEDWKPPRRPPAIDASRSGRERIITREEEQAILKAFHERHEQRRLKSSAVRIQAAKIFWLALRTGMRAGELLSLTRTAVSFEHGIKMPYGWIQVRTTHGSAVRERTKAGNKRVIPMSESVAGMLKEHLAGHASQYCFPTRTGGRGTPSTLEQLFYEACERAKIPYGWKQTGGIVFHDTRHTAATRMLHAGMDLKTIASLLGHSDMYMTMRYGHATPTSREAAVRSLSDEPFAKNFPSSLRVVTPVQTRSNQTKRRYMAGRSMPKKSGKSRGT